MDEADILADRKAIISHVSMLKYKTYHIMFLKAKIEEIME